IRAVLLLLADSPPPDADAADLLFSAVLALIAAALAGAHTGPAHARLPEVDLVLSGALPRRLVLRRPMLRVAIAAVILLLSIVGTLLGGEAARGGFELPSGLAPLVGAAGAGLLAAAAMLLGQLGRAPRWAVASAGAALAALFGTRAFGWLPLGWAAGSEANWGLLALGVAAAALAYATSSRVPRDVLREQSLRWSVVSALALTGDLHMATERLGAPVRIGRSWHRAAQHWTSRTPGPTELILRRDVLGVARTPGRSLGALAGGLAAGMVLASGALRADEPLPAAVAGAVAVLLVYASIGPWCRGLRAAAGTLGGAPLVPQTPSGLVLRHALVPGALAVLVVSIGCAATSALLGADAEPVLRAAACGGIAGLLALGLRLVGALKVTLPSRLLAPIPTPAGDMSGVNVLLWSLDGVFWAALI
ncbi:MAG: hypothetical protein J0H64_02875, partial [Actinobacteria bacterium]|nr:hypothetical protein [Actinomycetota bacterium]